MSFKCMKCGNTLKYCISNKICKIPKVSMAQRKLDKLDKAKKEENWE